MAVSLKKYDYYIVRMSIYGIWYDTIPMSLDQATQAFNIIKQDYSNMNVQIIAFTEKLKGI